MEHLPEALYGAADVRAADRRAVERHGLGDGILMERAGAAAFALLRERFPRARRIGVVCGPGNNGGDGYVVARLAQAAGMDVEVLSPASPDKLNGDARSAYEHWHAAHGLAAHNDFSRLADCDVIVDALLGTGLERPLEGVWQDAVTAINAARRPVLALDLPSGLHADSGRVLGSAVRAQLTLSFIGLKAGLFTGAGREYSGTILFDDLAVSAGVFDGMQPLARRITRKNLRGLIKPRARHAHKGEAGRVLIVGGQPGMPGAPRLAGEAAYRAGAGLVKVATHTAHAAAISAACPELIAHGVSQGLHVGECAHNANAIAVGPGLGLDTWGRELALATFELDVPRVVDADGLRHLAAQPRKSANWVLTPHPGEAAALLDIACEDVQHDRVRVARAIAKRYGGVCVLKGSGTIVTDGSDAPVWLCDRGGPALATAGTGDVLTGILAALLAQGLTPLDAARLGVWLHASAGDCVAAQGERGMLASDLLLPLRNLVNELV
jgi:NAD(P)H-hydrate epimerase